MTQNSQTPQNSAPDPLDPDPLDTLDDENAPIRPAYDIDPFTPLTPAPTPIPAETERDIVRGKSPSRRTQTKADR